MLRMINIYCRIPIAFLLSICLVYIWLNVLSPVDDIFFEQYKWGCYSIASSCIIEQCTQSIVLVVQSFCFVKLKVRHYYNYFDLIFWIYK